MEEDGDGAESDLIMHGTWIQGRPVVLSSGNVWIIWEDQEAGSRRKRGLQETNWSRSKGASMSLQRKDHPTRKRKQLSRYISIYGLFKSIKNSGATLPKHTRENPR